MTEETIKVQEEVISGPQTSIQEMETAIFNYVMTLTKFYMDEHFMSREQAAEQTAKLLDNYVSALRSLKND